MSTLSNFLYPVQPPTRTRPLDKPMSVLALGLSRSGTDSLRHALLHLGYINCYHGFSTVDEQGWADSRAWYDLLVRKFYSSSSSSSPPTSSTATTTTIITTSDLDAILGDCMALTDIPAVLFGPELLAAYPAAKVILNRRSDVQNWKESFRATTYAAERSWVMWVVSFFNRELFWMERIFAMSIDVLFHGQFDTNAEEVYTRHYSDLETMLQDGKREFLRWEPQHGWGPLCGFLGKEVPDMQFPRRNARKSHDDTVGRLVKKRVEMAMWNMALILVAAGIIAVWFGIR